MLKRVLARIGYVPVEHVDEVERALGEVRAALDAAWAEIDRERVARREAEADLEVEARFSADGCATALDEITGRVPVVLARHA